MVVLQLEMLDWQLPIVAVDINWELHQFGFDLFKVIVPAPQALTSSNSRKSHLIAPHKSNFAVLYDRARYRAARVRSSLMK